jgi:hypothetical protein
MPPQIPRLAMVFGVLGIAFFVARSQLVPASFGETGFYRADFTKELQTQPLLFAGIPACLECHSDKEESAHVVNGVRCESCHGPALKHAEAFDESLPYVPGKRADCGRCHAMVAGRRANFPQQNLAEHNPGMPCTDCHVVHEAPTEEAP